MLFSQFLLVELDIDTYRNIIPPFSDLVALGVSNDVAFHYIRPTMIIDHGSFDQSTSILNDENDENNVANNPIDKMEVDSETPDQPTSIWVTSFLPVIDEVSKNFNEKVWLSIT